MVWKFSVMIRLDFLFLFFIFMCIPHSIYHSFAFPIDPVWWWWIFSVFFLSGKDFISPSCLRIAFSDIIYLVGKRFVVVLLCFVMAFRTLNISFYPLLYYEISVRNLLFISWRFPYMWFHAFPLLALEFFLYCVFYFVVLGSTWWLAYLHINLTQRRYLRDW